MRQPGAATTTKLSPPAAPVTARGPAIQWARAMLSPRTVVILDTETETTDLFGAVVEIAVAERRPPVGGGEPASGLAWLWPFLVSGR